MHPDTHIVTMVTHVAMHTQIARINLGFVSPPQDPAAHLLYI